MKKFIIFTIVFVFLATDIFSEDYKYQENIKVISKDGTKISANAFIPKGDLKYPAIIFANSWAMEEHEYIVQAELFARKGYIVFSYSSRGWGKSEGKVTVAGPKDMEDLSACIDWIVANTPVDTRNIGASGISYGAGISLLGAAHDARIKTVVAMSGWGSLITSLYGNETPHAVWATILLGSGYLTGNMDPSILKHYNNLLNHTNVAETIAWANKRSPLTYIDKFNSRNVPIYISNNLQDEMFQPNSLLELFSKLKTPKRLDLNIGIHASAELGGLIGISNYVWKNAHDWFDYWLKGVDTGIMKKKPVSIAIKHTKKREEFAQWPSSKIKQSTYYLDKREWEQGKLLKSPAKNIGNNQVSSGILSGLSTGIPVIGAIFEAYTPFKIQTWIATTSRDIAIVYQSPSLEKELKIRGTPTLELAMEPSRKNMQLIAHLYDVDEWGIGTLITHAPITLHEAQAGKNVKISFPLVSTTYNIPKGHKLAIGIDTYDINYGHPTLSYYKVKMHYGTKFVSKLSIPFIE